MANESPEVQLALIKQWREQVEAHMIATDLRIKELADERTAGLKWGIITLGLGILGMGSWIFNFVTGHLK
jgi:hypothetical protein